LAGEKFALVPPLAPIEGLDNLSFPTMKILAEEGGNPAAAQIGQIRLSTDARYPGNDRGNNRRASSYPGRRRAANG
jgi:hypothetical protein